VPWRARVLLALPGSLTICRNILTMKKIVIILSVLVLSIMASCDQGKKMNQKNTDEIKSQSLMNSVKSQPLCIFEETNEKSIYLISLVRVVRSAGDELKSYAGGDELFLRYETRTILKNEENHYTQNISILRCVPERIALVSGGSYDTYAFYVFNEVLAFYENGQSIGHAESSGKWTYGGLASDNGIFSKIVNCFYEHRDKVPVVQENILSTLQ
jgi:hypothetical protein